MVDARYMLQQPPPPSTIKVKFDQIVVPGLIDAAGAVEARLERAVVRTRDAPLTSLGVAFGIGCILASLYKARAARRRPRWS